MSENPCQVSIIIKALNEEQRIAVAIESSLVALEAVGGEVILADSHSTDQTISIAQKYPIRIVQLANPKERCCGIGPQLGYQYARGEFIYILDGDMEMRPEFLPAAIDIMQQQPGLAGVGGQVIEMNTESLEYIARMERASAHMQVGEVDRLDMGGLYRRAAIEQVGYFSNRNLHSYEEFDLAVRLRSKGWQLQRLAIPSVRHYGHDAPPYQLLIKRWQTAYICGLGELIKAALGKPHLGLILTGVRELKLYLAVLGAWLSLVAIGLMPMGYVYKSLVILVLLVLPVVVMTIRKKSFNKAIYAVISWSFNALGLLRGLLAGQLSPILPIQANILSEG
jgi:Glycosyltransferases, probably involved in cell wall biogenesis